MDNINKLICELCEREVVATTKHHLVPKQKANKRWKREHNRSNKPRQEIRICIPCSKQIHALFTNRELKGAYNTLENLKGEPKVQKWIEWVRKKNPMDVRYHGKGGFHK